MPEMLEDFLMSRRPTAERPLLGQTVLLVEDSRFASDAMRLLCLRSGARIRRADSLKSAARHLATYRPSVAIVDLGLPDGSGLDLIADLAEADPRIAVLLATSGDDTLAQTAEQAGADGFLAKPLTSLALFQAEILDRLPSDSHPAGPRLVPADEIAPDRLALRDDLAHLAEVLKGPQRPETVAYAAQFLSGLALTADDKDLKEAAVQLAHVGITGPASTTILGRITGLIDSRIGQAAAV
ncbi:MAG: response regulator [Pseudomonadota bacterium]